MKYTKAYFLKMADKTHKDMYDYSQSIYTKWKSKMLIICKRCGNGFNQSPQQHINRKHGCRYCNRKILSQTEVIKRCDGVHKHKYNYKDFVYKTYYSNADIICDLHGKFTLTPKEHINDKKGCSECKKIEDKNIEIIKDERYKKRCDKIHNYKYDYSNTYFRGNKHDVDITCPKHGKFTRTADSHLKGFGCNKCSYEKLSELYKSNTKEFKSKATNKHNDIYDYSNSIYKSAIEPIGITCKKHGKFNQIASNHLSGSGCSICKSSKGELAIYNFLIKNNIKYQKQKEFLGCTSKKGYTLKFDFYIPELNICIEFDGEYHYKVIFSEAKFEKQKELDCIKNKFCVDNDINLLRIPYWEISKIDEILNERLI